jgi:cytochrome c2
MVSALVDALVVATLIVVPSLWLAPPTFWNLAMPQLVVIAAFPVAYLVAVRILRRAAGIDGRASAACVVLVGTAILGGCFTLIIFSEWQLPQIFPSEFPREALATSLGIGLFGLFLAHVVKPSGLLPPLIVSGLLVLAGLAGHAAFYKRWLPRPAPATRSVSYADTSLYQLKLTRYSNWIPKHWRKGGGLSYWGTDYLLANGSGSLYVFRVSKSGESLELTPVPYRVPLAADEFVAGAHEIFKNSAKTFVESSQFRVADVLVQEQGDRARILASHHHWNTERKCFVVRVSSLEGTRQQILEKDASVDWRTLYETSPCLPLNTSGASGMRFDGREIAGRMALLSGDELLLSVGDQGFDGVNWPQALSQDPASSYGKIMRISLESGKAEIFSLGHRTVQGLYVDPSGAVWSTEHGPRGGDELNLVKQGMNYGWPWVTYGTDYARLSWPLNATQGRHELFEKPIYAFVPSVGLSSLTGVTSELFPLWHGDLLVASLKAKTIWRTHIRDGRVIFTEPLQVAQRVRDLLIGHDGRVILWTDDSDLIFIEPTQNREGDALIEQCTGCHGLHSVEPSGLAPNLALIVGRPVASRDDFAYSEAMKQFGGRWTRKRLDSFLADPQGVIPGTSMQFAGIKDAAEREQIITFLEHPPEWW